LEQLQLYRGRYFNEINSNEMLSLPIELNYAPFALNYIRYKFLIKKSKKMSI
jgi:hypothetical protein